MTKKIAVVVLDATGSMGGQEKRVVSSMNEYAKALPKKAHLTVFMFNSTRWDKFFDGKAGDWKKMKEKDYEPGAMTPLYDCIAKGMAHADGLASDGDKVMIMIDTDGMDNASRECTVESCRKTVKKKKKAGWAFQFMANGVDDFAAQQTAMTGAALQMHTKFGSHRLRASNYAAAAGVTLSYFDGKDVPE